MLEVPEGGAERQLLRSDGGVSGICSGGTAIWSPPPTLGLARCCPPKMRSQHHSAARLGANVNFQLGGRYLKKKKGLGAKGSGLFQIICPKKEIKMLLWSVFSHSVPSAITTSSAISKSVSSVYVLILKREKWYFERWINTSCIKKNHSLNNNECKESKDVLTRHYHSFIRSFCVIRELKKENLNPFRFDQFEN